ncbi:MAG: DNA-3-methyladenine glycosylase family protein [Christensenellales bacterium]
MQNYLVKNNKIIVTNCCEFNITHILECGQIFRYKNLGDHYEVISKNKKAKIFSFADRVEIETNDPAYFVNFFDLNTSYSLIKEKLSKFDVLKPAIDFAYGIRILNQDKFEMIISFIISANNNIKRIQSIIEKLCAKFGTFNEVENFYAFPTQKQLLKASVADFKEIGAGYRAEYLFNATRQLENFDFDFISNNSSEIAVQKLLALSGVGPKVADCILLFGFHKSDVFPVDTWIKKVYNDHFATSKCENVKEIRKFLVEKFENLSGFAQQYLFYYKRSSDSKQ